MADWKNPADYPSEKEALDVSLDLWAWLFLLRNQDFKNEFSEAEKLPHSNFDDQGRPIGWSQTHIGKVLKKWGVARPMLPAWIKEGISDSPVSFQLHPVHAELVKIEGRSYRLTPESETREVLEFDLASPLAPQLARAKKMLDASKEQIKGNLPKESRKQVALYPLYLRVLDAMAAKASKAKMVEVFSLERPDGVTENDIRNWKLAAKAMASEGYKRLATLAK